MNYRELGNFNKLRKTALKLNFRNINKISQPSSSKWLNVFNMLGYNDNWRLARQHAFEIKFNDHHDRSALLDIFGKLGSTSTAPKNKHIL